MTAERTSVLDERGQRCPMPIIALGRFAAQASQGTIVELMADDPGAEADVPAWCALRGASLLTVVDEPSGGRRYRIELGPAATH